jgi:2-methylcitrate dehydratase PrpD
VGAALVYGRLTLPELSGEALHNPEVLRLSGMVELVEDDVFNARFPADRLSRVEMETQDGRVFDSGEMTALWGDLANPPTDEELLAKFHELARTNLSEAKTAELAERIWHIETADSVADLVQLLAQTKWE